MRRALLAMGGLSVAACPAPGDSTPLIHVDPRAARRLDLLSSAAPSASPDAGPASAARAARVHVMRDGEQLGGPNAVGRPGDLLLENDEVAFVVDQLESSAGFAESGGNLVDAADAHARQDELGQMFTYFGAFPRQGVYDTLSSGVSPDGSAWVEARGRELYEPKLVVTTRYTLHGPDRALLLETTLENAGGAPVELPSVGDAVQWGGAEKIAPGKARGFEGRSSGPYVGGVGRFTSYAITSTEGAIDGVSGGSWTDTAQRRDVKLAPGEKATYARVFVVGERADSSSLVGELAMAAGQPVGAVRVAPGPLPTGGVVSLRPDGSQDALTLAAPFEGLVPPGRYWASVGGGPEAGPIDVKAGGKAERTLATPLPASLEVVCTTPGGATSPCKVTFEGIAPTPDPDFGPAFAAGPARRQATTADGTTIVRLLPGRYRVTASRGPEYALAAADVSLAPGDGHTTTLVLRRVVDTRGYLACDFHQHTMLGADAATGTRDRVVGNAAEGVEIAVASEHNVVANLEPIVKQLGLARELVSVSGDELTTDASRHPWGHANVWPMPFEAAKPRGGAPRVRDRSAHEVFDELRAKLGGDFVLQVNHPRTGLTGYFDQLAFDPARGVGTGAGYDAGFDALEVWNGRNVHARGRVLDDWRALLRTGHVVTPTANTDTHGIVGQEAGYPRTYVRVGDDGHLDAWDASRTADVVRGVKARGDVVLTDGPMLRVTVDGAPVGAEVSARGRAVTVKVHVECAPWVDVDTVRVERVGAGAGAGGGAAPGSARAKREAALEKKVTLAPLSDGARGADVTFRVPVDRDDALYVVASGSRPMTPVLGGDAREMLPWAMTGAVWIDADGDGRALGYGKERR